MTGFQTHTPMTYPLTLYFDALNHLVMTPDVLEDGNTLCTGRVPNPMAIYTILT